jgi:hypothetical protein
MMSSARELVAKTARRSSVARVLFALSALGLLGAGPAPCPELPAPVEELVYARPFTLEEPFEHRFRAERPPVLRGTLLVLRADPALVRPRETAEPVLFVGDQTAEPVSRGDGSGRVVAFVPGEVDLARDPIFFGAPQLPEQVDEPAAERALAAARAAGIEPVGPDERRRARARGGDSVELANRLELLRTLASLVSSPLR